MSKSTAKQLYWIHPHFYNWMGGHKFIFEVISRLKKDYNYDVTLITSGLQPKAITEFKNINVPIVKLTGYSTNSPFYWLLLPFFLAWEKFYLSNIKKINLHAGFISSMFPANTLASSLSSKTAQLCYEPFAFFYDKTFVKGFPPFYQLFTALTKSLYKDLDAESVRRNKVVFTLSEYNRRWIRDVYHCDSEVVYEGVDLDFFKRRVSSKLKKRYQGKKLLFHATDYTPIKGTTFLLKALPEVLKKIPTAHLVISETLPDSPIKATILDLVSELKVTDHVEFAGFLPYDLLPEYLSLAEVVVQPSINQSMNLTVKEAMACETAVITSLEGNEQTKDNEAGFLVNPAETSDLAAKTIKLLSDEKLRAKFGKKGRQIVIERFSWDGVTSKIAAGLKKSIYAT